MTKIIEILKEVNDKLVRQKEQIIVQQQKAEKLMEENEKKFKTVDKEVTEKEGDKTPLLFPFLTGQSNLICSTQPIIAHAGDDVILSCRLDPPISASSRTVEWTKPGLDPEYIHVHQDGRLVYQSQNPLYNYRTALFVDQLINGNVSMKLFRVKTSDAGKYKCFLPSLWKEAFIELKIENKNKEKKEEGSGEQLMTERKKMEDLDKIMPKLNEELQNKDEEQKEMTKIIEILKEVSDKLFRQKEQIIVQQQKAEKLMEENEKKFKTVDKEVTEKEGDKTVNRAQGYLKLKEIIQEANWDLDERRKDHQQLQMNTEELSKSIFDEVRRISEKKKQVESDMQQIKKQMEEIQRKKMHLFNWFGFWLFLLYSLPVTTGQSNLICSTQPIIAHAGDDVILSCRLDPPISASSRTVEWTKPGLDPEYIHVHQDGRLVYQSQNPLYNYRTALFVDQLINGNVSMKLFRVKTSDAGKYKCFLPSLWKEAFIELKIGQSNLICSAQPIIAHAGDDVILSCRLDPPISASSRTVEWTKPGLDPEYIHVHQDGRLVYQSQNPLYNYRTALFVDQLINGNVSMKLFRVKTSDAGKYKCFLPSLWKEAFIELKIGKKTCLGSFVAKHTRIIVQLEN
ncbi:uncharacterized protein [Pagrus major]|uniref:uncharacterized protein n=1 Tax=Pagrus major TaxID=143350 RepID=UPI003CC8B3CF